MRRAPRAWVGGWRIGELARADPVLGSREVALRRSLGVEDYVRHLAVFPLMVEERAQLLGSALCVEVREPYGDEAGVPAPLVRVELRGSPRPPPHVVVAKDFGRPAGQ